MEREGWPQEAALETHLRSPVACFAKSVAAKGAAPNGAFFHSWFVLYLFSKTDSRKIQGCIIFNKIC